MGKKIRRDRITTLDLFGSTGMYVSDCTKEVKPLPHTECRLFIKITAVYRN